MTPPPATALRAGALVLLGLAALALAPSARRLVAARAALPAPAEVAAPSAPRPTPEASAAALVAIDRGLPRRGQWRNGFEVVDLDGDGHLDLVHGPMRRAPGTPPSVFLGDGRASFREAGLAMPALAYDYGDVAALDVDRDGALDLALAAHLGELSLLARRGAGFERVGAELATGAFSSRAVAATTIGGSPALVALSDGPRAFGAARDAAFGPRAIVFDAAGPRVLAPSAPVREFGDSVAAGDLDGDGVVEILAATSTLGSTRVLYRIEGAALAPVEVEGLPERAIVRTVALEPGARAGFVGGLLQASAGPEAFVARVVARDGAFEGRVVLRAPGAPEVRALASGDVDGDGAADLVVGDADGALGLLRGPRLERAEVFAAEAWRGGCSAYHLVLADVDEGGAPELVANFAAEPSAARCPSGGGVAVYRLPAPAP